MSDTSSDNSNLIQQDDLLEVFPRHAELANGIIVDCFKLLNFAMLDHSVYIDYNHLRIALDQVRELIGELERNGFPDFHQKLMDNYANRSLKLKSTAAAQLLGEYALDDYWRTSANNEKIPDMEHASTIAASLISMVREFLELSGLTTQQSISNAIIDPSLGMAVSKFLENLKTIAEAFNVNFDDESHLLS